MKIKAVEKELLDPGWRKAWQPEETVPAGKGTLAALEIGQRVRPKKVRAAGNQG
jgi:NADPH-dependent glutamate synthase beta subunit-like oxidoreductase